MTLRSAQYAELPVMNPRSITLASGREISRASLFNALNGIAILVREQDSVTAAVMVDALGTFLRPTRHCLDAPEL